MKHLSAKMERTIVAQDPVNPEITQVKRAYGQFRRDAIRLQLWAARTGVQDVDNVMQRVLEVLEWGR